MSAAIDTSRHDSEHMCPACEQNRTGYWATIEVLEKYGTDEVTPAMQDEIVGLCVARGSVAKVRDAV